MNALELSLRLAGLSHFGVLVASALTPGALDWKRSLAPLHPFLRRLFWVYGTFIVLVIVSFGCLTLRFADVLADGAPLGRAVCAFIFIFWLARLGVQLFVFDPEPFLTKWWYRVGYHLLTAVFTGFVVIYGCAAFLAR